MKTYIKVTLSWILLLLISLFPVLLWFYLGSGLEKFIDYSSITHDLGELFGLIGMTMFALTFMLSTRIRWIENLFEGLDKVYVTHGILGGLALIFILFHPLFLVLKFIPSRIDLAAKYLLPSSYWSVNFGIISILGLILLIFITLFTKIKYNKWKLTHEFLGLMFIFAILHIFLVRNSVARDNIFNGYYVYAAVVSIIGLFGFSYSLFIKDRFFKNAVYSIKSIKQKNRFFEITLIPEHKPISYKSGQFVFLRFYNKKISKESHPFSLTSNSNNQEITVLIKQLGDYTKKLVHLKPGDKVLIEGPYGRFNYKKFSDKNQVWIAGGIGVAPFLGMVKDLINDFSFDKKAILVHSVRHQVDLIGDSIFKRASQENPKFRYIPWVSEQKGRINLQVVLDKIKDFKDKEFFICGPAKFKNAIIQSLIKKGVKKHHIHEEVFDFR